MIGKRLFSKKVFSSTHEAIKDIKDGSFLMVGGFGVGGTPNGLINALKDQGTKNLTIASNNCGVVDWGLGLLLEKN